jgi:hypothetical protein
MVKKVATLLKGSSDSRGAVRLKDEDEVKAVEDEVKAVEDEVKAVEDEEALGC